jgi:hypothetical protein
VFAVVFVLAAGVLLLLRTDTRPQPATRLSQA